MHSKRVHPCFWSERHTVRSYMANIIGSHFRFEIKRNTSISAWNKTPKIVFLILLSSVCPVSLGF